MPEAPNESRAGKEPGGPEDLVEAVLRARREEYREILRVVAADIAAQKSGLRGMLRRLQSFVRHRLPRR